MTTRSLATRARTLLDQLGQVREQEQNAEARNAVERARARACRSREILSEVVQSTPALCDWGVARPPVPEAMLPEVTTARRTLRSTATSIAAADTHGIASRIGTRTVDHALGIGEKLAKYLVTEFNKSVDRRRFELLPHDINRTIVPYPGASDSLVVGLQTVQRALQVKVEGLEVGQLVQRLGRIIEQIERWERERPRLDETLESHHPEIKEFLRQAATDEGAPWDLITPRVQKWLAEPEHTAALRIVLRS